ncbi:MAG: hypothetical protein JNK45_36300 [Myxococcales bacterium]|jgi:hypothetical protein|nr:hypothetical protein [Myxococcales bacterium]
MHQSICVVFDEPRVARRAYRALRRSSLGARAASLGVHYRRIVDGKLQITQTRPVAGAIWGSLAMSLFGAAIAFIAFGTGDSPAMAPWLALLLGAAFGAGVGGLAGALVGTTEPEKRLADAESMLAQAASPLDHAGHAAVVAEYTDPALAAEAERLLLRHEGAHSAT